MVLDDSDVRVELTSDRMEASITLLNAKREYSADALTAFLASAGVSTGVDKEKLKEIAARPVFNLPFVVAHGKPAVDGKNEIVEFKFPTGEVKTIQETTSGSLDFRSISNFYNFRAGDLLALKTPATEGQSGFTVTGEELMARPGKATGIRVGKGAKVSEDGMSAVAEDDGHACIVGDRITVQNTVEVPSNLDYSVGNIKFIGSVRVRGHVMPDFIIETEGDIEIAGNVEKATVKCGGNLTIHGIVFGQGECLIEAKGNATVGAVDQAEVKVLGNLVVNNYVRHSSVSVGGGLVVQAKKGNIVGGDIHCFRSIEAPFIGNAMATLTKLTVGSSPFVSHEIESLEGQLAENERKLQQVNTALSTLASRASTAQLDARTQELHDKLEQARRQLEPLVQKLNEQLSNKQAMGSEYKEAKIKVSQIIYPGVIISFRDKMQYKTQDEQQHVTFYEEAAEIHTGPY